MAAETIVSPRTSSAVTPERYRIFLNTEHSVRNWIGESLKIPLKGDLMDALKNGIVLCYLMRQLDEQSIPRIQEANHLSAMAAQENILFFLSSIADYGVPTHKRFFMMDLWNGNSRPRVVECLAELARIASAKKFPISLKVSDLPIDKLPFSVSPELTKSIYDQLSKTINRDAGVQRKEASGLFKRKIALMVGQKEYPEFERRWTRIQALVRAKSARMKYNSRVMNQAFRDKVAKELLDTEHTYVAGLKECIDRYLVPLRDGTWNKKLVLDRQQIKTLFSDIEIIFNYNKTLQTQIDNAMASWSPSQKLGNIFVSLMGFLKVYANYVSTCDAQLSVYENMLKSSKLFVQFVEENRAQPGVLDIPGYLIMPIQRVPRYFMLLERLLKNTWKEHPDYSDLERSVSGLADIAMYLNEKKRTFENLRTVMALQLTIQGCPQIAIPTRSYVATFDVQDVKKKEDFHLLLFNDLLVLSKSEKKKGVATHKFKESTNLANLEISEKPESIELSSTNTSGSSSSSSASIIAKFAVSPESSDFAAQFNKTKIALQSNVPIIVETDTDIQIREEISPEELLKQREQDKKQLKVKMQEEMKLLKSQHSNSSNQPLTSSSTSSTSPTSKPASNTKLPGYDSATLRSTQSLLKMKAIVEQQINVLDTQVSKDQSKADEYKAMASTLGSELEELDRALDEVKAEATAEDREALAREESAVRLQVSEEPKTMRTKKKARKSFFASFFSSSSSSHDSNDNQKEGSDSSTSSPGTYKKSESRSESPVPGSGKMKLTSPSGTSATLSPSPSKKRSSTTSTPLSSSPTSK